MSELFIAEPRLDYQRLPPLVVDASVLAAVLFGEAQQASAEQSMAGKSLFAPWLIDHEIVSVSLKMVQLGFVDEAAKGLADLAKFRIVRSGTNVEQQLDVARRHDLSAYDAAYLQLALELNAPLATFDRKLAQAAQRERGGE